MIIIFWMILSLMVLFALSLALWPLIRSKTKYMPSHNAANIDFYKSELEKLEKDFARDMVTATVYEQLKSELERGLLQDIEGNADQPLKSKNQWVKPSLYTALLFLITIPGLSLFLYSKWGDSNQLSQYYFQKAHASEIKTDIKRFKNPQQLVEKMLAALEAHPNSARGWFLLGRLYAQMNEYPKASHALLKAIKLKPENLEYKLQYAQASFFAHDKKLNPLALTNLNAVLAKEPNNPSAINLFALNAFAQKNYQLAIDSWEKLLNSFPANSENSKVIMEAITTAQKRNGEIPSLKRSEPAPNRVGGIRSERQRAP